MGHSVTPSRAGAPLPRSPLSCQTVLLVITNDTHFGAKLGIKMFKEKEISGWF